jgi:hypothetical protein
MNALSEVAKICSRAVEPWRKEGRMKIPEVND